ncbi:MAG TPA: geranylgeranylglycerol-phosphate geranylgeranyltransferase [Flavobacterium sp.]
MNFLKLIRYQNLLMLALMQLIFKYGFLDLHASHQALNDWQYLILVFATVCIAAGGYLINNIFDQETDRENKPKEVIVGNAISEGKAYNYYVILNVIGVGCGFYLSNFIGRPGFSVLFIGIAATLYLYASSLKQSLLAGNIIVALLLALSVVIIGVFDLFPVITPDNRVHLALIFEVLTDYAIFAFIINFIREIVKDLEDVNGDYNQGMNTLPIVLGVSRTAKIAFYLGAIPVAILLWYINKYYVTSNLWFATAYSLFMVVGPMIYFLIKMWGAKSQKEFGHLSGVLKFVLLFGILSVIVVSLNIKYNA